MQKNRCLNFFKGIACIMVVFMHFEFPGRVGVYTQAIGRFAVPLFFMISGYFCVYDKETTAKKIPGKMKHIALLALASAAVYTIYELIANASDLGAYIGKEVTAANVAKLLLFNEPFIINGHLWFLFALIYVYALYALVNHLNLRKAACIAAPILLAVVFIAGQGVFIIKGVRLPNYLYRNFLFEGFPLFMFGNILRRHGEAILARLSNPTLLLLIAAGTVASAAERYIIGSEFGLQIGAVVQVVAIFAFAVKNPALCIWHPLEVLGEKYSLFVYLYHFLIGTIIKHLGGGLTGIAAYAQPLEILAATIVIAVAYYAIRDKIIKKV